MTRRSITTAAGILPLLALPLFFSGLSLSFILKPAMPAARPLLLAVHYLGAAFSGILFAVLVHSLGDTLLLFLLPFPFISTFIPFIQRRFVNISLLSHLHAPFCITFTTDYKRLG